MFWAIVGAILFVTVGIPILLSIGVALIAWVLALFD